MLRRLGGVILILSASAACSREPVCREQAVSSAARQEGMTQCTMAARMSTRVRGAETINDNAKRTVAIVEFYRGKLPKVTWFASVAMALPVDFAEKLKYRAGFNLAPGSYRGPGRYTLTTKRPTLEGFSSPLFDDVFVEVSSFIPDRIGVTRYGISEPCKLSVRDKMTRGKLECPKLAAEGREVSLSMTWEPA